MLKVGLNIMDSLSLKCSYCQTSIRRTSTSGIAPAAALFSLSGNLPQRQQYREGCPFPLAALHPDFAAMIADNTVGNRQPQAGSTGLVEGCEQLFLMLLADAAAIVRNRNPDAVPPFIQRQ